MTLKHEHIYFVTSCPLLIPLVHRTTHGLPWFPDSAVTNHSTGTPGSTSGKRQAMPVQGEAFGVRISKCETFVLENWGVIIMLGKQVPGYCSTWSMCRSPLIRIEQPASSPHAWPLCAPPWGSWVRRRRTGLHLPGALKVERRSLKTSWTRDPEPTSPGHQGLSLRAEVSTCWCVNGVTLKSLSGFAHSLPWVGRRSDQDLCLLPGNLRNGRSY